MIRVRYYFLISIFIVSISVCYTQSDSSKILFLDTAKIQTQDHKKHKNHSPRLAAILSAVAPGAGQIYNKKYWKLPIVWGGLTGLGYLWVNENNRYQDAKTSYLTLVDKDPSNDIAYNGTTNATVVGSTKNVYRNQRDMYLLFGILFYGLNIIDATVDAHFMNFDVNDDLSMKLNLDMKNYVATTQAIPSLTCTFRFK